MTKEKIVGNPLKSNLSCWISYRIIPTRIILHIADVANLKLAWYKVKGNAPSLIIDIKPCIKENKNWLLSVSKKLLNGEYKYKKINEISVFKNNIGFYRLKVVAFRDIVVQKAFFLVLSAIFEKQDYFWVCDPKLPKKVWKFNRCQGKFSCMIKVYLHSKICLSYKSIADLILNDFFLAFHNKKSVHFVMRSVQINWRPLNYFAKCKINRIFNSINHSILMKGLEEYVKDKKVCNEIWKMLQSKNVDFKIKPTEFNIFSSLSNFILSSFLLNVYMIKFDRFLDSIIVSLNYRLSKVNSTNWLQKINNSFKTNYFLSRPEYFQLSWGLFKRTQTNKAISFLVIQLSYKLFYTRYMSDFIMGYYGKQNDIKKLLPWIEVFIKFNLQLNCTGFKLIGAYNGDVSYLGFQLKCFKTKILAQSEFKNAFEKLKRRLTTRKFIENSNYLKALEWAGLKFYRKIVEEVVGNPDQVLVKRGIYLEKVLTSCGQRDGLIYLITVLKQSLRSFDIAIENSKSLADDPYYKVAEQLREIQCKEFFQRWSEAAKTLARIEIEDGVREFLPLKTVHTLDVARNNFLSQINKLNKVKITMILAKNFGLAFSELALSPMKKMRTKVWNYSIKLHLYVKNIMNNLREQGIVNKNYLPICFKRLCSFEDYQIINKISIKAYAFMSFYSCVNNLWYVKKFVNYILRYSLAFTLARKFKVSIKKIFQIYGKDLSVRIKFQGKTVKIASFPSKSKVDFLKYEFSNNTIRHNQLRRDLLDSLNLFKICGAADCQMTYSVEIYRVTVPIFSRKSSIVELYTNSYIRASFCWKFLSFVFRCRTIALCHEHYLILNRGFLYFFNLNLDFIIQPAKILKSYSVVENFDVSAFQKTNF